MKNGKPAKFFLQGKEPPKKFPSTADFRVAAEIIGICDMYESLTHHRNWREPLLPHETMKALIKTQTKEFDPRLTKVFLEQLSLYPPGSFIELTTGEIASVIEANAPMPTRPIIEIRVRADGNIQDPALGLDLKDLPLLHIARAVDETKLNLRDKKVLLQLQAQRWWTE